MRNHPDGRPARRNGALWTAYEDQVLRTAPLATSNRELAARLGRTQTAVMTRRGLLRRLDSQSRA